MPVKLIEQKGREMQLLCYQTDDNFQEPFCKPDPSMHDAPLLN
jgi:hypothetical protein